MDCYIGATEVVEDDPLNKVYPGEFNYGGGHVIQDLVAGKKVHLKASAYGTDCYPNRLVEKDVNHINFTSLSPFTGVRSIGTYYGAAQGDFDFQFTTGQCKKNSRQQ